VIIDWINIKTEKPTPGQRCLIWHTNLGIATFAYYIHDDCFSYLYSGSTSNISVMFWISDTVINEPEELAETELKEQQENTIKLPDPPYSKDAIELYRDLGIFAAKVLKLRGKPD